MMNVSCSRTQRSDAGEARIRNHSVLSQALYHWATALPWNGSGWYGFIREILASMTDISLVVHLHAIGNIRIRVYFLLGPVAQSEASPVVHLGFVSFIATLLKSIITWRLVMKTNIRSFANFRWFNKGSCQFQVKVCAKSTVSYPYFTQGPNPMNWQILQLTYEDHSFWNWCPRSMDGPFL